MLTSVLHTGKYIIQVARFDPAKGIPEVIKSYAEFRRLLALQDPEAEQNAPQLVMSVPLSPSKLQNPKLTPPQLRKWLSR